MWLKQFTEYLLSHRLLVLAVLVISSVLPYTPLPGVLGFVYALSIVLLASFVIVYPVFVTLRQGVAEGAIMTAAATVPFVVMRIVMHQHGELANSPLLFWGILGLVVVWHVLPWIFASMLTRQMTWSAMLQVAALAGVMVVSIVHLVNPDIASWWGTILLKMSKEATATLPGAVVTNGEVVLPAETLTGINLLKNYMNGLVIMMLLLSTMLQVITARLWQAILYAPGMLRRELQNIRLSPLAGILFILSQLLVIQGNSVLVDSQLIIYMLFAVAGLSVIHYFMGLMVSPTRWFWIALIYVVLFYGMRDGSIVLLSMIGLLDIWLDLRKRLRKI